MKSRMRESRKSGFCEGRTTARSAPARPIKKKHFGALEANFGFKPSTSLREGLRKFAEWYKEFYKNILRKEDSLTNENEESTFR